MSRTLRVAGAIGAISLLIFCCSKDKSTNPGPQIPNAPSDLSAQVLSSSSIQLIWADNSDNEDGFIIFRKVTGEYIALDTAAANQRNYVDAGLQDSTDYYYYVVAFNAQGTSAPTDTVNAMPSSLFRVGSLGLLGIAQDVFVSGNYAYVSEFSAGLQVVNVANPAQPTLVGSYATPGSAFRVFVTGNYAYIADGTGGIQIINVTNPSQPTLTGHYASENAFDVFVSGGYAYVTDRGSDYASPIFEIVSIADPSQPVLVGTFDCQARNVFIRDNMAYLGTTETAAGFTILDVTDPTQPALVGQCAIDYAVDVYVSGNYAYVAGLSTGLKIINITHPNHPTVAATYRPGPSQSNQVFVSGDYAYLANGVEGVFVVNITDPSQPTTAGFYDSDGSAKGIYVSGGYVYVAADNIDLHILRFNP
jgi:hypothetical protein